MRNQSAKLIPKMLRTDGLRSGLLLGGVLLFAQPQSGFAYVLAAREGIELKGNGIETDSYDSRTNIHSTNGRYDPAKRKAGGDLVASVGTNLILNVGNATIAGHLVFGPAASVKIGQKGTVGSLSWITNTTGIEPGFSHDDMSFDLSPEVYIPDSWTAVDMLSPFGAGGSGSVAGTNYDHVFTANGNYAVSDNGTIYVGPSVIVRMKADYASFGPERIIVAGGTKLFVYVTGPSLSLSANYIVQSGNPGDLWFIGLPACTTISFKGDGDFIGTLYAPDSDFQLENGGSTPMNFTGSAIAKNITVKGNYHFHCDEASNSPKLTATYDPEVVVGESVWFPVFLFGLPFKCQWQFEGIDIAGATNTFLRLTNIQLTDAGQYTAVFTEPTTSFTNGIMQLRVYASGAASLTSAVRLGDQFQFKVSGVSSHRYSVQSSKDLKEWISLKTNSSPFTFIETNATALPHRFYRAVYLPY